MHIYAIRLQPDMDLRSELENLCKKQGWPAAWIVTCVGSLRQVHLRMAGAKEKTYIKGPLEITSLVGTLSQDGIHLHINVSDKEGRVYGGHLCKRSSIFTTAEIVIGYSDDLTFERKYDQQTGYAELSVTKRSTKPC